MSSWPADLSSGLQPRVLGFSFFATLLAGTGALSLGRIAKSRVAVTLAAGAGAGAGAVGFGVVVDRSGVAAAGIFVAATALGVLLGGTMPAAFRPMLLVLVVLSALDILWIAVGGGSGSGLLSRVGNFTLEGGTSTSSIDTIDLVVAAGLSTHWLARGTRTWIAVAPGPIGMILSNIYVAIAGATNLALVPFLLLGWLITEALDRRAN